MAMLDTAGNPAAAAARCRNRRRGSLKFVMICSKIVTASSTRLQFKTRKKEGSCPPTTWSLPLKIRAFGTAPCSSSTIMLPYSHASPEEDMSKTVGDASSGYRHAKDGGGGFSQADLAGANGVHLHALWQKNISPATLR
jgi:hypothetical protein